MSLLSQLVWKVRRNHAIEHATMHLLSSANPTLHLVGRSDWRGFSLYGEVDTHTVLRAASEAIARLRSREGWLAIHPNCGTNLAAAILLTGGAAYLAAVLPARSSIGRVMRIAAATMGALVVSRPVGAALQQLTTTTDLTGARVQAVRRELDGKLVIHRIAIAHADPDASAG